MMKTAAAKTSPQLTTGMEAKTGELILKERKSRTKGAKKTLSKLKVLGMLKRV